MAKETSKTAYTRETAAASADVPGKAIDAAIKAGELKAVKCGRRYIILDEDLRGWLRLCRDRGFFLSTCTDVDRERLAQLNRVRRQQAAS